MGIFLRGSDGAHIAAAANFYSGKRGATDRKYYLSYPLNVKHLKYFVSFVAKFFSISAAAMGAPPEPLRKIPASAQFC